MAEYIAREVLLAQLRAMESYNVSPMYRRGYDDCVEAILKAPAADVVPVVRCKDCIHYDLGVCLKIYSDGNVQKDSWQSRNPNDFCSYGEKNDGGVDIEID